MNTVTIGPPLPSGVRVAGAVVNGLAMCSVMMAGYHSRSIALAAAADLIRGKAQWLGRETMVVAAQCQACGRWHLLMGPALRGGS